MADEKTRIKAKPSIAGKTAGPAPEVTDSMDDADVALGDTGDLSAAAVAGQANADASEADAAYQRATYGYGLPTLIIAACAALVLGVLVGRFLLHGGSPSPSDANQALAGKVAVTEDELDTVMATYTYAGEAHEVTVRDAILENGSLEASRDAGGNYRLPSIDAVLTVARNRILMQDAEARGFAVTDEELAAYSETTLGTSDYAYIAASYGMDEEGVKSLLRESAMMSRLHDSVVGSAIGVTMPEAPAVPETTTELVYNEETGEEEWVESDGYGVATPEYASYIISLAGDEWDAEAGTWASYDGPYAQALYDFEIYSDGATYEAAQAAYYVAYQLYGESMSNASAAWSDYVNSLLSNACITFATMVA